MPYKRPGENFFRAKVVIGGKQRELLRHASWQVCRDLEIKVRAELDAKAARLEDPELLIVADYRQHRWLQDHPRPADGSHRALLAGTRLFGSDAEFGRRLMLDLTRHELERWFASGPGKQWMRVAVRLMLEDACDDGLLDENPLRVRRKRRRRGEPKAHAKEYPPIDPEMVEIIAAVAGRLYGPTWAALIRFQAVQGLRTGELATLEWGDVDLEAGTVSVLRQDTPDGIREPKWGSSRTIPLFAQGRAALAEVPRQIGSERIWHSSRGLALNTDNIQRMWQNIRRAAGLHPATPIKALRASAATRLRTLGASSLQADHLLGENIDGGPDGRDPSDGRRDDEGKAAVRRTLGHSGDQVQDKHYVQKWPRELNDGLRDLDDGE